MRHPIQTLALSMMMTLTLGCEGPRGEPGPPGGVDPAATPLEKAIVGVGGQEAIENLAVLRIEATGERFLSLQGYHPDDDGVPVSGFDALLSHDLAAGGLRIDYGRDIPLFGAMTSFSVIVDGEQGYIDGTESVFGFPGGPMLSDRWAAVLRQHRLLNPHVLLADALAGRAQPTDGGLAIVDGSLHHRLVFDDEVAPVSLYVNARTGEIAKLETAENDYTAGDIAIEVHYLGWRTWDGDLLVPAEVLMTAGGQVAHLERRRSVEVNVELAADEFDLPEPSTHVATDALRGARNHQFHEGFASLGIPLDGLQTAIAAEEIAPGVFFLGGGSHNSMAVVQEEGVVLVEAPLYEARAVAILEWIEENHPGKPVTHVIATHHHRDHVGALRTLVARGATVIVGEASRAFFERSFRAARTIDPDELAKSPRSATVVGVPPQDALTLPDPTRPVSAQAIETVHAADMVAIHLPAQGILFNSDLYSPGLPVVPFFAGELLENIRTLELAVTTMVGGHGGVATFTEFEAEADGGGGGN